MFKNRGMFKNRRWLLVLLLTVLMVGFGVPVAVMGAQADDDEVAANAEYGIKHNVNEQLPNYVINLIREIGTPAGLESIVILAFDSNGGVPEYHGTRIVRAGGEVVDLPPPPTKAGYYFVGWFTDDSIPHAGYDFTGAWVAVGRTAPDSSATLCARWVRPLNIGYYNLVSINSTEAFAKADNIINEIKPLFETYFGIRFVQEGAAHYEPRLNDIPTMGEGTLFREASLVLDYPALRSTDSAVRFRFVDYPLWCGVQIYGMARPRVERAEVHLGEMIIGFNDAAGNPLAHERFRYVIAHEVSHVVGAPECRENILGCVMSHHFYAYNNWCDECRNAILSYVWRMGERLPHLISLAND